MKIGFIGQGWIGKHYADDFVERGYDVVRYSLETPYINNKHKIRTCDIVFVAVPTPTTPEGFVDTFVRDALTNVGEGMTVVIKSTLLPGTTEKLQSDHEHLYILHSPEFLVEKTAAYDAAHPNRNIVGIPRDSDEFRERARAVLEVLPAAPYTQIMSAKDAELVKYAGNCFLYTKVMFMNLLHDLALANGSDYNLVREALVNDPRIGESHTEPVHSSGRGAGGHCFIKDFEAFRKIYGDTVGDVYGDALLTALVDKNLHLLVSSNKDIELVEGVYGDVAKYRISRE